MTVLIGIALKSLLIAGLTLGLLELMKRRSAAERSWIAHAGLFALVLVAVAPLALPNWNVEGPAVLGTASTTEAQLGGLAAAAPSTTANPAVATSLPGPLIATPVATGKVATPTRSAAATAMVLYAIPAAILLFVTMIALARLVTLQARADVLVDGHWLSALARAQRRMGFKHGTALLISDELASPISWGLLRPVILLNPRAVEAAGEAEAIIAHELAHVARMDWIKLLLARVATALFWFNPLVWLLARESHQLREEAADDAVLEANIPDTDYAQLLVGVARHDTPGLLLGAHGVAPSKSSLARRVSRVLDGKISRGPVARSFAAGVFVGAVIIGAPLAALTLVPNGSFAAKKTTSGNPAGGKSGSYAPYYAATGPTDLPTIISQGVSTSVRSAVAAINPNNAITLDDVGDFRAMAPNGASVTARNGVTTAVGPDGATTTVYPADSRGHRKVVTRAPSGATVVTYAGADGDPANHRENVIGQAIGMKALGMTPQWVDAMRATAPALRSAPADDLMGLKAVGATPEYVRDIATSGLGNLDADALTSARAIGLTGEYIRSMRAVGLGGSLDDFIEMRAVGVTPAYAVQFRRAGYKLSRKKLVDMRAAGVDLNDLRGPPAAPPGPRPPAPPGAVAPRPPGPPGGYADDKLSHGLSAG